MSFNRICITLILLFFSLSTFSQTDSTRRDSIEEIIIYEYDTVYIQPDTIRITDTIFDIVKTDSIKKTNTNTPRRTRRRINEYTMKGFLPRSLGLSIAPFVYINPGTLSDTLKPQQVFNMAYHFQLNYYTDKYMVSYRLAYSSYHERFGGKFNSYTSNQDTASFGTYDSIRVVNNYQADYYYDYLSFDILLGRKFNISNKFDLNLTFGASAELLLNYRQGNTAVADSMVRKTNFSLIFSPQITYKISRKFEFKLAPYFQHAIFYEKKYPHSFRQRAGIEIGFNYVL